MTNETIRELIANECSNGIYVVTIRDLMSRLGIPTTGYNPHFVVRLIQEYKP